MKKHFALVIGLFALILLEGCASKDAIRIGQYKWTKRGMYLQVPHPEPVEFTLPFMPNEQWAYRVATYSIEHGVFRVQFVLGEVESPSLNLTARGATRSLVERDSSFTPPPMASDSAVVMYFMQWDAENSFENYEPLKGGSVLSSSFNKENGYGLICLEGKDDFRECSAVKLTEKGNFYVVTAYTVNPMDNPDKYVIDMMESFDHYNP
ncbi:MAG: hypothetical protein MJZ25_15310 [Fibrobacter sp.]|nr:hypothetical protein [Fibrobacter sp.]